MVENRPAKVVFGCPSCKSWSDWPKTPYGEAEKHFKCAICGAVGEGIDPTVTEISRLLQIVLDDDLSSRQNAAEREIRLERLAENGYSSPDETSVS